MRKIDFEYNYVGNCSVCAHKFAPRNATILSRKKELSHVYAECGKCKSSVIIFVLKNTAGFVTTIGMLTDMKKEDILKFRTMDPLTSDDVLELHRILEHKEI